MTNYYVRTFDLIFPTNKVSSSNGVTSTLLEIGSQLLGVSTLFRDIDTNTHIANKAYVLNGGIINSTPVKGYETDSYNIFQSTVLAGGEYGFQYLRDSVWGNIYHNYTTSNLTTFKTEVCMDIERIKFSPGLPNNSGQIGSDVPCNYGSDHGDVNILFFNITIMTYLYNDYDPPTPLTYYLFLFYPGNSSHAQEVITI